MPAAENKFGLSGRRHGSEDFREDFGLQQFALKAISNALWKGIPLLFLEWFK